MIGRQSSEDGFSLIEMLVVMTILSVILGGMVALFTAGITADADQNRRFQAQQDGRLALDKVRRELHSACTISTPATYNTPVNSVTAYFGSDSCVSGAHTVTYCTTGSAPRFVLYRKLAANCTTPTEKVADYLTTGTIFDYLPPNAHVLTLGGGTSAGAIVTQDGGSVLPRLHIDMTLNQDVTKHDGYHLVDDIAFRNGLRFCAAGVNSC